MTWNNCPMCGGTLTVDSGVGTSKLMCNNKDYTLNFVNKTGRILSEFVYIGKYLVGRWTETKNYNWIVLYIHMQVAEFPTTYNFYSMPKEKLNKLLLLS